MSSNGNTTDYTLALASSSPYRATLLEKFGCRVTQSPPNVDETPLPGETAAALAQRLSSDKARAVAELHPHSLVIGSDQVATVGGTLLGKPGSIVAAEKQLSACSGRWVRFTTGLCVINTDSNQTRQGVEHFDVLFRDLSARQIATYLNAEQPYDCAGSFKSEGLGIALFQRWSGRDPNSLVGLPMMLLVDYLSELGFDVI